jgi:hypothetical protein
MQRAVFSQFRMPLRQILFEGPGEDSCYHGKAIDQFLRRTTAKTVVLFDVDAVPLSSTAIPILLGNINPGICGAAQQSNHKNVDHPYAGPSCVCFNMSLYHTLANPSFEPDDKSDVGERLTWAAQSHNTPIALLTPIAYEKPGWRLGKVMEFGRSTIYACQNGKPLRFLAEQDAFHLVFQIVSSLFSISEPKTNP